LKKDGKFNYNLIGCIFIYVMSALFLISTFAIEDQTSRIFPQVLCILSILLATVYFIQILRGKYTNEDVNLNGTGKSLLMAGIILLYILGISLVGFYIASLVFLPIGMIVLGQRSWKVIVGVDIGVMLFIYLFFGLLLSMQMPESILF